MPVRTSGMITPKRCDNITMLVKKLENLTESISLTIWPCIGGQVPDNNPKN